MYLSGRDSIPAPVRSTLSAGDAERIALCEQALREINAGHDPSLWAALQAEWALAMHNLGEALCATGSDDGVEQAIQAYRQALTVRDRNTLPQEWAQTLARLGRALLWRTAGDRAENVAEAIRCLQLAMDVQGHEQWVQTAIDLALAYRIRLESDPPEACEQALNLLRSARPVAMRASRSITRARLERYLGTLFACRPWGCRAENLRRARECYRLALAYLRRDLYPQFPPGAGYAA